MTSDVAGVNSGHSDTGKAQWARRNRHGAMGQGGDQLSQLRAKLRP